MSYSEKNYFLAVCLLLFPFFLNAQELFPHNEPASNIPKGVLGFRITNEVYKDVTVWRSMQCYKFMWGFTPKLMLTQAFTFANHHGRKLPDNFITNDGNIGPHAHGAKKGNVYPYGFENLSLTLKYRFLSNDGENHHFRMAAYLEAAKGNEPHDEAEPSFMGDNSGWGAGLVSTYLKNKFAASITTAFLLPYRYIQNDNAKIEIHYGNAFNYNLSFGYLLFPRVYKEYKQTNVNLYVEFMGKAYDKVGIKMNGKDVLVDNVPTLDKGNYVEIHPSVQFIFKSNTRIDLSIAKPIIGRSYAKTYPVYSLNVQHYFYFK
jgi:hypothetical protein